jgi:hypothetical protein
LNILQQTVNGVTTIGSTLASLENMYRDVVNQYVGYAISLYSKVWFDKTLWIDRFLQPTIVQAIQNIGMTLMPQGDPGSPAASMQTQINNAILVSNLMGFLS